VGSLIVLGSISLSACSIWPSHGSGGMAEHRQQTASAAFTKEQLSLLDNTPSTLKSLDRQLDALLAAGIKHCFPASVVRVGLRSNRINRELQGGLKFDALNNLIIQTDTLTRLERQLNTAKQQQHCVPPLATANNTRLQAHKPTHGVLNKTPRPLTVQHIKE